jgi:hypothetical protein
MSTLIASAAKMASNAAVNLVSRSREPEPVGAVVKGHEQIAGLLGHPLPHRMRRHPEHMDLTGGDLDHKQHVQTFEQHRVHGEEVHRQDAVGLGPQELPPRERRPDRCRVDTAALQDGPDGAGPKLVPEPAQLTVDAAVAPGRVLPGQPQHQIADLQRHARTATPVG